MSEAQCCYRCEQLVCRCGAQGYMAIPLPMKFHIASDNHETIDDHEHDRLKAVMSLVMDKWFEGYDEFDLIDALNSAENTRIAPR